MSKKADSTAIWNEAAVTGLFLGALSVVCLLGKEAAALSGIALLVQGSAIVLWMVEFLGCILIMKNRMLGFRERFEGVKMEDTHRMGRRSALLSGLILASAQALIIMKAPQETMDGLLADVSGAMNFTQAQKEEMEGMMDSLPIYTFIFQWIYCFLYGCVLSSILSRYIFLQSLFGPGKPGGWDSPGKQDNSDEPDIQ